MKVAIIGAGIGGLSTACCLAKQGHDVMVVEKNKYLGGRAGSFEAKGFRFDMGPSWYLMPDIFEDFFAEFGHTVSDFYEVVRLDPSYKIFFDNYSPITLTEDMRATKKLFETIEPGSSVKFQEFLDQSEYCYNVAKKHF